MKRASLVVIVGLFSASVGCGGKSVDTGGGEEEGGSSGDGSGGSSKGGKSGKGGSGAGGQTSSEGGSVGSGGAVASGGSTGQGGSGVDAAVGGSAGEGEAGAGGEAAGGTAGAGSGGAAGGANGNLPENMIGWYEAEAIPPNTLFGGTKATMCGTAPPCASIAAVKEGVECCSGGKKLSQLLRGKGGVVLNQVMAPADGVYDFTWWFHCGKNDNFGDTNCGGAPHTASGCRPHILEVNGTKLPKVYHFPCFPGSWGQIHASTTQITLKAGANSIRVYATPGRDAADLDAQALYPMGKGVPPLIAGTNN
jgi:hypothetical protein